MFSEYQGNVGNVEKNAILPYTEIKVDILFLIMQCNLFMELRVKGKEDIEQLVIVGHKRSNELL